MIFLFHVLVPISTVEFYRFKNGFMIGDIFVLVVNSSDNSLLLSGVILGESFCRMFIEEVRENSFKCRCKGHIQTIISCQKSSYLCIFILPLKIVALLIN